MTWEITNAEKSGRAAAGNKKTRSAIAAGNEEKDDERNTGKF